VTNFRNAVRDWYQGRYVPHEGEYPRGSSINIMFVGLGHYESHWTATAARTLVAFWLEHWKWIVGVVVAVAAIAVKK
jgi:hypothetical protein